MIGSTTTPTYSTVFVNGSAFDDDLVTWRIGPGNSDDFADGASPNMLPGGFNGTGRFLTNTLGCSNLGQIAVLPMPSTYDFNIVLNGLGGSDLIGIAGNVNNAYGGDGDDGILSYLNGNSFVIDGGAGNDRIIQDLDLSATSSPFATAKAGSGNDCMLNRGGRNLWLDCASNGFSDKVFYDYVYEDFWNINGLCQNRYTGSYSAAVNSCWFNGN
jgi:hypothetical protein